MINDNLLSLIKTLTPREKTVFKRHASLKSENRILNYVVLFDIYNKLLKKKVSDSDWVNTFNIHLKSHPKIKKDLRNVKKRLKDKILESLVADQTGSNPVFQSTLSLNILKILFERKLFSELQAKIKQLKKQALQNEWYKVLIEINDWENKLLSMGNNKDDLKQLKVLNEELQYYLNLHSTELTLISIYRQMNLILERDIKLNKKESRQSFDELRNHSFLRQIDIEKYLAEKNIKIINWFFRIQNLHERYLGNIESCYINSKKLVELFETDETLIKIFEKEYIGSICSFTRACFKFDRKEELDQLIKKTTTIYLNKKHIDLLSATCDMGVLHFINTMQYNEAEKLIKLMESNWDLLKQKISPIKLLLYAYNNFILYWILANQKELKKWSSLTLSYERTNRGKSIIFNLRLLLLISDYDLDKLHNFNEKIEALKKTLDNNEYLTPFEKIIFQYLRELNNTQTGNKGLNLNSREKKELLKNTFKDFKNALVDFKESQEKFIKPTTYDEVLLWIESKIQQKSIREVFEASVKIGTA